MVSGISASASTIGSNYCGANAVYAAKPPERTSWININSCDKYWSSLEGVWKDIEFIDVKADRDKNFSRKESWRRAEAIRRELLNLILTKKI